MNKLSITLLIVLLPVICAAQSDVSYFDKNRKSSSKNEAAYKRVLTPVPGKGYKVEDYYTKNGQKEMTGYFATHDSDIKNGAFVYYDDDGLVTSEGSYANDEATGEWKHYYEHSTDTWYVTTSEAGSAHTTLISYYKDGKVKRREAYDYVPSYMGVIREPVNVTGKCYDEQGKEIPFTSFEQMPKPDFDLQNYLVHNLVYPPKARKKNIEGRVVVKFVVNEDGSVSDAEIVHSVWKDIDNEALRVVSAMPKWKPGIQDDKAVKVYFTQPLRFVLE